MLTRYSYLVSRLALENQRVNHRDQRAIYEETQRQENLQIPDTVSSGYRPIILQ